MTKRSSETEQAAGKLYKVSVDSKADLVEKVFEILKFAGEAPLQQTLETYRDIKKKWLILAEITTAKALTAAQKVKVESYITASVLPNVCFLYEVDTKLIGGIKIQIGDNVLDESVAAKIRDLTL
jgi:hypothetical protein